MPLALDGSNTGSSGAALIVSLTTTNVSGLICAACATFGAAGAIASVTAPGLTFSVRTALVDGSGEVTSNWYAPYTSNFSGFITITPANPGVGTTLAAVFGISGAIPLFGPGSFDPNAPTTDILGSGALSLTTANANDFVFTNYLGNSMTPGAGWTGIATGTQLVEWQILSSPQTVTGTFSAGFENLGILDGVIAASSGLIQQRGANQVGGPAIQRSMRVINY